MTHSPKYLIHADIRASGVVERSDVVGAIFGQTEGLLGNDLDLRDLQEASKVGRIDVSIESEGGRTFGTVTIASRLGKAETAVLGAALETIERVGPCRADCTVAHIEDARAAKRRELVDRATELLAELDETTLSSEDLVDEVRQQARVEDITEYEGLPAGPRVAESDAIVVVEGRADVRQLLQYGIRNAIAVEGTDVPDAIASLTTERTTTAFLDGDRGGDLILRELAQVGDIDYVAFAPSEESVEDLDRSEILAALRKKLPFEQVADGQTARETFAPPEKPVADGSIPEEVTTPDTATELPSEAVTTTTAKANSAEGTDCTTPANETEVNGEADTEGNTAPVNEPEESAEESSLTDTAEATAQQDECKASRDEGDVHDEEDADVETDSVPQTLGEHVDDVIGEEEGTARWLDKEFAVLGENDADVAHETLAETTAEPYTVVVDGPVTQRLLDVAAQRGVAQVVGASAGDFVKRPTSVRIRTAEDVLGTAT